MKQPEIINDVEYWCQNSAVPYDPSVTKEFEAFIRWDGHYKHMTIVAKDPKDQGKADMLNRLMKAREMKSGGGTEAGTKL